ncbi:hypothetical protein B5X24_HaOG201222 [Helicoverpa armigera]|nr:hypothetical protein B5X24_HaOG201222 [Helicoverpa armigera]
MLPKIFIALTVILGLIRFRSVFIKKLVIFKYYLKLSSYYVLLTLTSTLVLPLLLIRPKHYMNGIITSSVMRQITKLYGVKWHIRNGEILAEDRGAVIISNHQSVLDIAGMNFAWQVIWKLVLIAKKEVLYTGPLGIVTYLCGSLFIDRKKPNEAYKVLESARQLMRQNKTKIWIFPEGTRNTKWDGKLLPFKKGAFNVAVSAQVPIIPLVYSPYYFIDKDKYIFNRGHMILQCLDPVPTEGLTMDDVPALADRMYQLMSRTFEQLSKEVQSAPECQ